MLSYLLAFGVAYLADLANLPLAWVLGALVASAAVSLSGVDLAPPQILRKFGQCTIGAGVGLYVTASVAVELLTLLPVMVGMALLSIALSAALSIALGHLAGLDHRTAFLAMLPGGLAEMANVAASSGAEPAPVAVTQALRVALVVMIVPPLLVLTTEVQPVRERPEMALLPAAGLIAACMLVAALVRRTGLNNPWMLGAALFSGILTAGGITAGAMPDLLFNGAQFLLGFAIGSRFKREIIARMPVLVASFCGLLAVTLAIVFFIAWLASRIGPLGFPTMLLSIAPGGTAEMSMTAQALSVGVTTVTGFHVTRAFLVNGFINVYWNVLTRIGFFEAGDRVWSWLTRR